jgi:hypothetical protein
LAELNGDVAITSGGVVNFNTGSNQIGYYAFGANSLITIDPVASATQDASTKNLPFTAWKPRRTSRAGLARPRC